MIRRDQIKAVTLVQLLSTSFRWELQFDSLMNEIDEYARENQQLWSRRTVWVHDISWTGAVNLPIVNSPL